MNTETYLKNLNTWRNDMSQRLRAKYGWLALVGLFWLEEGENSLGSAPGSTIQLPARAPGNLGALHLANGQVWLHPAGTELVAGANSAVGETPVQGKLLLHHDHSPQPTFLFWQDMRMLVLQRGDRYAMRAWDPQQPLRQSSPGRQWHAPDLAARVTARIERHEPPRRVPGVDIVGTQREMEVNASLHFEYNGVHCQPDAELLPDGRYSLMIKDAPGSGNYGGGRFLDSELPQGDEVVLDLNTFYNPPCSFTPFATCPVPTPNNVLPVAIMAGELYAG